MADAHTKKPKIYNILVFHEQKITVCLIKKRGKKYRNLD